MPHSPEALTAIERAISRERLKRYLAATGNDLAAAVSLYEKDVTLSEFVFGLHGLEVAIGNSMHEALSTRYVMPQKVTFYAAPDTLTPGTLTLVACGIVK